jgi:hypothetical protein
VLKGCLGVSSVKYMDLYRMSERNYNVQSFTPSLAGGQPTLAIDPLNNHVINVDIRNMSDIDGSYIFTLDYDETLATKYPGMEFTVMLDRCNTVIDVSGGVGRPLTIILNSLNNDFSIRQTFNSGIWPITISVIAFTLKSDGMIFSLLYSSPGDI